MPKKAVKGEDLTEEERLLQLQQRAQAEEETARKKEETLTLYLKDKLQKEQRNTAVNLLKLTDSWRRSLRQSRAAELLSHAAVLQHTSERHLDELSFIIQRMAGELQEAERQAEQLQRCHLQHMERLWEQQQKQMLQLQQQWDSCLQDLSATCSSEREKMSADFLQQNHRLVDLSLPSQIHHQTMSAGIQNVYREVVDSCSNADHVQLDDFMDRGAQQEEGPVVKKDVFQQTRNDLDDLQQRLPREQQQLSAELKNLKRLKDKVLQLKQQISSCQAEQALMQRDVSAAKLQLHQRCQQLQVQLERDRREARNKVTDLSVRGGAAVNNLRAVISKGEKLLQAGQLSSKLQNHQEVLAGASEEDRASADLQLLQQRLNAALLRSRALRNHSLDVRRENQQLQVLLDQHDHGLQGHVTPMPVLQVPSAPTAAGRRHVMEAAHIIKHCLVDSRG
ncbi:dynein regulatory complex subunit 2 [Fundulus heteroclitus]|uniref:dynein regulatory complex subunit 2 n=1 Tax=Fundulus heteroclitus TaxID=8078 RepID=UPI00165A5C26|nr:dynein regulatory complex subunit 2 [Fundulus heteroclitus]XP_035998580.1 dynein regulatory complex subunit 2 [Fundulus heteroclitus]XP_035998581.1 dynein regulatory complex subunit 2 [Fundulus heteroclitus]XP_035998582.1 dynein regulatory complex subunit 2 [Fundulus heteroclitus]